MTAGAIVFTGLTVVGALAWLAFAFSPMGRGDDLRGGIFYRWLHRRV